MITCLIILIVIMIIIIMYFGVTGFTFGCNLFGCICMTISIVLFILMIKLTFNDGYNSGKKEGYKSGQIDALSGHVEYKLESKVDSTKVWVEIESKK